MATVDVNESLIRDLAQLGGVAAENVAGLAAAVLEFLIHKKSAPFQAALEGFASTGEMSPAALKAAARSLIVVFESGMREGWSAGGLYTECIRLGLPEDAATALRGEWSRNASHIASSLLAKTIAANELIDVDWSFGVTASTSDSDQVGRTYLQMKLTIRNDDEGKGHRDVYLELSLEQFYSFLAQIETCKSHLDLLTDSKRNASATAGAVTVGGGDEGPDEASASV